MSQFVIYPEKLKSDISRIDDISNNAINNAINQLHSISSGLNDISMSLSPVVDQLINKLKANQAKVRNLSQTGHTIVQKYVSAENTIMGAPSGHSSSSHSSDRSSSDDSSSHSSSSHSSSSHSGGGHAHSGGGGHHGGGGGHSHGGHGGSHSHGKKDFSLSDLWDGIKKACEIWGMSTSETLHLLIDIPQALGSAGIDAIVSAIKGDNILDGEWWKNWAYKYVPNHVDDKTMLAVFTLMSIQGLDDSEISAHYQNNVTAFQQYLKDHSGDYYIEDQNSMDDYNILYGSHTADYNSCEVIATYNALLDLNGGNSPASFPELLSTFESAGIAAGGEFGTDPTALYMYFDANGYDADMLTGGKINSSHCGTMQNDYETYILTTYNNKDNVGDYIHTVSITSEVVDGETKYFIHNASGETEGYDSLYDAVSGYNNSNGEPISLIGVK